MVDEIERLRKATTDHDSEVESLNAKLKEQNDDLTKLQEERRRHLEEAYEMK